MNTYFKETGIQWVFSLFGEKAQTDRHTAYISILIMQPLLSNALIIIAMHSALLFRNHYEGSDKKSDLFLSARLVGSYNGRGKQGRRGRRKKEGGVILCGLEKKWRGEGGRRRNERDAQFIRIEFWLKNSNTLVHCHLCLTGHTRQRMVHSRFHQI